MGPPDPGESLTPNSVIRDRLRKDSLLKVGVITGLVSLIRHSVRSVKTSFQRIESRRVVSPDIPADTVLSQSNQESNSVY